MAKSDAAAPLLECFDVRQQTVHTLVPPPFTNVQCSHIQALRGALEALLDLDAAGSGGGVGST